MSILCLQGVKVGAVKFVKATISWLDPCQNLNKVKFIKAYITRL